MTMPAHVNLTVRCSCDTVGVVPATTTIGTHWSCPTCGRDWLADHDAVSTVIDGTTRLRTLRRTVVLIVVLTVALAAVLGVVHPPSLLGVPMLLGAVALVGRPTYRTRARRALTAVRTPISLQPV